VAAFMMLIFLIAHVYLTTTGHTPLAHIKAMITGWEETH
jgi:thiosulfate reductase cytochrome b subunit